MYLGLPCKSLDDICLYPGTCCIAPHHRCDGADGTVVDASRVWSRHLPFLLFVAQQPRLLVRMVLMMASCFGAIVRHLSCRVREERLRRSGGCGTCASSNRCSRGRSGSFRRGRDWYTLLVSLPGSSRSSVRRVCFISAFYHRDSTKEHACAHPAGPRCSNHDRVRAALLYGPCVVHAVPRAPPRPRELQPIKPLLATRTAPELISET